YRFTVTREGIYDGRPALVSSRGNAPDGRIYGAEINWQQHRTFLPGLWSNFGVFANYTYTDAYMKLADEYEGRVKMPLAGQSKNTYTAALFYEADGFSVRLSYTRRSDYLDEVDVDDYEMDLYWEGRSQLDLTGSYEFNSQWEAFFEAK